MDQFFKEDLKWAKEKDIEAKNANKQEITKYNEKYPYLIKPINELNNQEKQSLVMNYVAVMIHGMLFSGKSNKEINQFEKEYKDIEKLPQEKLAEMQKALSVLYKPRVPEEPYYENYVKKENSTINFKISREEAENPVNIDLLEQKCKELLAKGIQVRIVVNTPMAQKSNNSQIDYLLSSKTMQRLINLNNNLHHAGMKSYVMMNEYSDVNSMQDINKSWTLKDVVKANRDIDAIANDIKQKNLSPFETIVYIHRYITSTFAYQEGAMEECRVIPGIFKSGNIVCSGYASLVKALVDKLDMPELKCMIVGCELYSKSITLELEGGHCHNLIYIKDEKYGIDGYYVEDACWDAKTLEHKDGRGFAHCLYPVGDLEHMNGMHYVQHSKEDRLSSLIFDPNEMQKAIGDMQKVFKGEKTDSGFKQYLERRSKVKSGADIVLKYKTKSAAIDFEKYSAALKNVLTKFEFCDQDKIDQAVNNAMILSAERASRGFDKKSSSTFVNPNAKKSKVKNSLKSNDGRQG